MATAQENALKQSRGWNKKVETSFGQGYNKKEQKRTLKKNKSYQIKHF